MPKSVTKILLICLLLFSLMIKGSAQEPAKATEKQMLFREISRMDSLLFLAFNTRNIVSLQEYFTTDLEVYQDNTGLRNYAQTVDAFTELFRKDYILTRSLVKGSMEVYPIRDYGAIQTGSHEFSHMENGRLESAVFKFTHIWQKTEKGWKIRRLITYDH